MIMNEDTVIITVPASTANLGPGFDSVGLALNRYLQLEVSKADEWSFYFEGKNLEGISNTTDNLIYEIADQIATIYKVDLPACHVKVTSEIPLGKGMGSSAAAIVAGIQLANHLGALHLTREQVAEHASSIEGHPDNAGASVYGGLIIGTHGRQGTFITHGELNDVDIIMMVPSQQLLTKKARGILPEKIDFSEAIEASSVSNVLVAALLTKNWPLAGEMMIRDLFHQPHRISLVPGLEKIISTIKDYGAYGAALSGAGPTLIVFAPVGKAEEVIAKIKVNFPDYIYEKVQVDHVGEKIEVIKANVVL